MWSMPVRLREAVSLVATDDGGVLLDQEAGRYWQINRTGHLVLSTLLGEGDRNDAVEALVRRFGVSEERARDDVSELVARLTVARLVVA
jgi:hypothetical protein